MAQLILTSYKSAKKAVLVENRVRPYAYLSINSNNMYIRKIFFERMICHTLGHWISCLLTEVQHKGRYQISIVLSICRTDPPLCFTTAQMSVQTA